jgi:uncharacterized membrane protein YgdD (TMEM256/DUF423 family)
MIQSSRLIAAGAINGVIAVAAGAFAAHALKDRLEPKMLDAFETGARYQMYHALAMILAGIVAREVTRAGRAGWLFQLGIVLFSGSLYGLALTGERAFAFATPFGGVAFLVGWVWLAITSVGSGAPPRT